MKIKILTFAFCCLSIFIFAQTNAKIKNIRVEQVENNNLEIRYNLVDDAGVDEYFTVSLNVYKANGEQLEALIMEGDIRANVSGGLDKVITVKIPDAYKNLSTDLYVDISATSNLSLRPPYFTKERVNYLLKSTVFPGWGKSELTKKPWWLIGVTGYSALGASVYFNRRADANYTSFLNAETIAERNDFFNKAENHKRTSEVLAYTAGGIWLGNIIWSFLDKVPTERKTVSFQPFAPQGVGITMNVQF